MSIESDVAQELATKVFTANLFGDHPNGEELSEIIRQHAIAGVASGFIPVPGMDVAAAVGVVWTMYIRINHVLGIHFSKNIIKSITSIIGTNLITYLPGVFVGKAVASFAKLIPGLGTMGGVAIDATINLGLLYAMGVIYAKSLTTIYKAEGQIVITEQKLREAIKQTMADKTFIKQIYEFGKNINKKSDSATQITVHQKAKQAKSNNSNHEKTENRHQPNKLKPKKKKVKMINCASCNVKMRPSQVYFSTIGKICSDCSYKGR
jgi:uncharacterized protein (DUF697 family)